jgi:hypothetical protein
MLIIGAGEDLRMRDAAVAGYGRPWARQPGRCPRAQSSLVRTTGHLCPPPPAFDTALAKIVRRNRTHSTAAGRTDQPTVGGFFFGAVFSFNSWSAAAYSRCASSHSFAAFSRRCPARRNPLSSRSIDWATRASDHIRISTRNPFTIEIVRLFSVLSTDGKRRFARTNGYGTNRS